MARYTGERTNSISTSFIFEYSSESELFYPTREQGSRYVQFIVISLFPEKIGRQKTPGCVRQQNKVGTDRDEEARALKYKMQAMTGKSSGYQWGIVFM